MKRLETLSPNILNLVIYVSSPTLEYFIRDSLKNRFGVHRDFVVQADTVKELQNAKLDSYVAPFVCDKWLIHVNADKFQKKDLSTFLEKNTPCGLTVYWTSKYGVYKQLQDLDVVKKRTVQNPTFSFSRLGYGDIMYLHDKMVGNNPIDQKHLVYLAKNYMFDVEAVCTLFSRVRSGLEIESRRTIVEEIGTGGNTVASLTVKVLQGVSRTSGKAKSKSKKSSSSKPRKPKSVLSEEEKDNRARGNALKNALNLLDDLSLTTSHDTIRRFMLRNLDGFIEMKELQIMGIYNRLNKEIPDTFDEKRLSMLRRFERVILNDVILPDILNLKMCLLKYDNFNSQLSLVQALSEYYSNAKVKISDSRY